MTETTAAAGAGPARRATIDDVARAVGVSRQTVSNVLRQRGRLSPETRARVEQAISDLRYAPHPGASSMRSRRTMQLAYLMPPSELDPSKAVALEFLAALVTAAAAEGYFVLVGSAAEGTAQIEELINSARVDAFVFSAVREQDQRIRLVADRGTPFASFGRTDPALPQSWVDVDNADGVARAVDHLATAGHTRIGFLGIDGADYWEIDRAAGYRGAVADAGLEPLATSASYAAPDLTAAASGLLTRPDRPTAMIGSGDLAAAAIYRAAERLGFTIGGDLAVIGFEGGLIARNLVPALTAITIPVPAIAAAVISRALAEISGGPTREPGRTVRLEITPGESA